MRKPRIIIADSDINYVVPLQLKFAVEFFDRADLEIITEKAYFDELFTMPQIVDVLIVSEEMYDSSVQKHNVSHIFLMTEEDSEEQTSDLNVNCIFKYTSIKEIFNEIVSQASDVFSLTETEHKETQIILVYSASGGVGKTTIAMGISACLTKNHKRTLYINAEHIQTFQRLLDNPTAVSSPDVYATLSSPTGTLYEDIRHVIRKEQFSYVPPFRAGLMSLGIDYSIYAKIAMSAKKSGDYDFIVIDADTSFDKDKTDLIGLADRVIVVTTQNASSIYATNVFVSNITGVNADKYLFICNNFRRDEDNALISASTTLRFTVTDYIEHIVHYDEMRCADFAANRDLQKVAFLII